VDSVPDPLLLRKSGRPGIKPRTSGYVARNSGHYTTEFEIQILYEWNLSDFTSIENLKFTYIGCMFIVAKLIVLQMSQ
jgi:hypothetical protein